MVKMDTDVKEINMVMLGHTGAGKSSTGNSILGKEIFDSYTGITSMTTDVTRQRIHNEAFRIRDHEDKDIFLADTPGFFDTRSRDVQKRIKPELEKFKPHIFLLVISLKNRFPKEAEATLERIDTLFGEKMYRKCVVVFSGADYLKETSIESFVRSEVHPRVAQLIQRCGNRYAAFDNHAEGRRKDEQVSHLAEVVSEIPNIDEPFVFPSSSSSLISTESFMSFYNFAADRAVRCYESISLKDEIQKRPKEENMPLPKKHDDDSGSTMLDIDYHTRAKRNRKRERRRDFIKGFVCGGVSVAIIICILFRQSSPTSVRHLEVSADNLILRIEVLSTDTHSKTCFEIAGCSLHNIPETLRKKYSKSKSVNDIIEKCWQSCLGRKFE